MDALSGRSYRDLQAWTAYGVVPSTQSDIALQAYDAALASYYRWGAAPDPPSPMPLLALAIEHDPLFALAHIATAAIAIASSGVSTSTKHASPSVVEPLRAASAAIQSRSISIWEQLLFDGTVHASRGHLERCVTCWEEVLLVVPTEPLSLKLLHDLYFLLGWRLQMRDSIARVIHTYSETRHGRWLYGCVRGMFAFALEECGEYSRAFTFATEALELDKFDAWATHARFHIFEMQGKPQRGIEFGTETIEHWSAAPNLAAHNFWHMALFHLSLNQIDVTRELLDTQILPRAVRSGEMLDLVDASSLLFRLRQIGVTVHRESYEPLVQAWMPHIDDHFSVFNDSHFLMTTLGAGDTKTTERLMDSITSFIEPTTNDITSNDSILFDNLVSYSNEIPTNIRITRQTGMPIFQALLAYESQDYSRSMNLLAPIRYDIVNIGGSNAQRDVYELTLLHSAIKCQRQPTSTTITPQQIRDSNLARALYIERKTNQKSIPIPIMQEYGSDDSI